MNHGAAPICHDSDLVTPLVPALLYCDFLELKSVINFAFFLTNSYALGFDINNKQQFCFLTSTLEVVKLKFISSKQFTWPKLRAVPDWCTGNQSRDKSRPRRHVTRSTIISIYWQNMWPKSQMFFRLEQPVLIKTVFNSTSPVHKIIVNHALRIEVFFIQIVVINFSLFIT